MYTKITAIIIVKPEAMPIVAAVMDGQDWEEVAIKFPWLKVWGSYYRADFIPHGVPCERSLIGRVWNFSCELKNYCGEIEYFFAYVLPRLAESVELLETQYEAGKRDAIAWTLENGVIVRKGNQP